MGLKSSDGWLWVSLAILGYFGSHAVHKQLVAIRQASEVTRNDRRPNISQQTEDALKLKALSELAQSPDQDIRAASLKIILNRAIRDGPVWDTMIYDIAGTDIERRDKALVCLRFLCDSFPGNKQADIAICRPSTYKAIVDCLCNLLPEARTAERNSAFRTQTERNALHVLHYILGFDVTRGLEAGVIGGWLAQYPFGGPDASKYKKKKTITEILMDHSYYDDSDFGTTMQAILFHLSRTPSTRKEMVAHGLLDVLKGNDIPEGWDTLETLPGSYGFLNRARRGIPVVPNSRPREESFEEQALRRRRREAMVLGEVGRPIERDDIIEQDSAALDGFGSQDVPSQDDASGAESDQPLAAIFDEDVEEELEHLIEETLQAESTRDVSWWGWLERLRPDGLAPEPV